MNDDLDLSAVAADAALLDALSAGTATDADDLAGLAALRAALDEDLSDLIAAPAQVSAPAATPAGSAPVVLGLHRPSSRSRRSRQAAALLAGAALALSSTGVAAATYEARPGDAFYGLRTAVAGPRAEDPALLRERLDAVQERLDDAPASEDAADELAEVAALLSRLDPSQRGDLAQRLSTLTEQLAASATPRPGAAGEGSDPARPAGPPQGVPAGPPADAPATGRPEGPRPEPTRGEGSTPPSRPTAPPSAQPDPPRATSQPGRPTPDQAEPEAEEPAQEPQPRRTQGARPSQEPAPERAEQEPAEPGDDARAPREGSAADAVPAPAPR